MIKRKHLERIKKFVDAGGEGITIAHGLLLDIAIGKKLSQNFQNNLKAREIFHGFRRYRFVRKIKEGNTFELTTKGENKLQNLLLDEIVFRKPRKWDGKWRLVMYDFPIRFKKARNAFRWKLKNLGFFQFQKSAWIYPYPCEGEILFVADFFGVRKHVEILEVGKILDDKKLKAHFCL